ncbi:N-acetylmuramoyl-L-alanine amidase [Citricoccus sp. GCM10030269]|uniref:peptidoglycan recognition protein family protein n=1 Tax=Citricoccus sp. GCM10030269 TaxID=3273388 RepID=UPI003618DB47
MSHHLTGPQQYPSPTSSAPWSPQASATPQTFGSRFSRRRLLQGTAVLGGAIAFGSAAVGLPAFAATVSRPDVISTSGWGASDPKRSLKTFGRVPTHLVIHHTTHENSSDYSASAAEALARLLQRNHFTNGWADTGQHFTVARGGQLLEGRHGSLDTLKGGKTFVEGAHAYGFNDESVGIEVDGMYMHAVPTEAQWTSLVHLSAYICQQYGIPVENVIAHRDVPGAQTLCCGDAFYAKLSALRNEISAARANGVGGSSSAGTYPTVRSGDEGEAVRRLQASLDATGHDPGSVDGVFGPATEQALRDYQASIGTLVDGIAGHKTWGALATHHAAGTTVRRGDSGTQVEYLQRGLSASLGKSLATDGIFGPNTESAVRSFQEDRPLAVDGIAGPATWYDLQHGR